MDDYTYKLAKPRVGIGGGPYFAAESFSATVPASELDSAPHAATIEAYFSPATQDWVITAFTAHLVPAGKPLTTESLREMAVGFALRQALHAMPNVVTDAKGDDWYSVLKRESQARSIRKSDGPTPENLADVANVYRVARLLRDSTTLVVASAFGLPDRTATHWIKLARERGHFDEDEG